MSLDKLRESIVQQRCYQYAHNVIRCPRAGVTRVTLIHRIVTDGQLRQVTEKGWGCREHSEGI